MKKLLVALMMVLCMMGAALAEVETFTEGMFEYVHTDDGAVITEYLYPEQWPEVIEIPAELGEQPVVGIAEGAFTICTAEIAFAAKLPYYTNENGFLIDTRTDTLIYTAPSSRGKPLPTVRRLGKWSLISWAEWDMNVVIPEGVEEIGAAAFYDVGVASLQLPESLKIIETDSFFAFDVEGGEVSIPAGVKNVQFGAFGMGYVDSDPTGREYWHMTITPANRRSTRFETYFEYAERTGDDYDMEAYTLALYDFELTEEGAVITNWNHNGYGDAVPEVVTLPEELGGHQVVGIGYNALNTYEMYYEHSFTLVIPEGVKWLAEGSFQCCHNADAVYFPASLVEIPEGCFDHVYATFIVAEGNPRYAVEDGFLIDKQTRTLLYVTPEAQGKAIPAVRRIGSSSMDNWFTEWGEDLVIPEGVEEIGSFAFYDWEFGTVTLPESLRVIETEAFNVFITQPVHLPAQVELVQRGAFFGSEDGVMVVTTSQSTHFETAEEYEQRVGYPWWEDTEETEDTFTEGMFEYTLTEEGAVLMRCCFGDTLPETLVVPETLGGQPVVGIGENAFNTSEYDYDERIQYIVLPEGVHFLADNAFWCCHNASVVVLPASLAVIPEGCFHHFGGEILLNAANPHFSNRRGFLVDERTSTLLFASMSADNMDLPAVRRLGESCLNGWEAPDGEVYIPDGVEEIGVAALTDGFYTCLRLPESLRKIEHLGLYCMVELPVVIPAGCTEIDEDALPMLAE